MYSFSGQFSLKNIGLSVGVVTIVTFVSIIVVVDIEVRSVNL